MCVLHSTRSRCSSILCPPGCARAGGDVGSSGALHTTLAQVLLRIPSVQPELLQCLLQKLPEFVDDGSGGVVGAAAAPVPLSHASRLMAASEALPTLILRQLRFLDFVQDCPALVRELLTILQVRVCVC